jgi:hypothetical protein
MTSENDEPGTFGSAVPEGLQAVIRQAMEAIFGEATVTALVFLNDPVSGAIVAVTATDGDSTARLEMHLGTGIFHKTRKERGKEISNLPAYN